MISAPDPLMEVQTVIVPGNIEVIDATEIDNV